MRTNKPVRSVVLATAALTLAILSGLAASGSVEASPQAPMRFGEANKFCLWEHRDFGGRVRCFDLNQLRNGLNLVDHDFDDTASSLANNTSIPVCFYTGDHQSGGRDALGSGNYWRNLQKNKAPDGDPWNDRISSLKAPC